MPAEWDSLTGHAPADGSHGSVVGDDTGSFPAIRDEPTPARWQAPWWWPVAMLLVVFALAAVSLLAPEVGGVPIPIRPDSVCRCGVRIPI